jgi:alpha/beta superfamily hydrolase
LEDAVVFSSGGLTLEGMLERAGGTNAVVVTHPHPLYGGDMDNPVVLALCRAYAGRGYGTLRFNFRGTGASAGVYGEGRGERQDVAAALRFLSGLGLTDIDLAGYSFGAWVNAGVRTGFRRMVMVSPPVVFMEFGPPEVIAGLGLILTGSRDDIAPPQRVAQFKAAWGPQARLEIIPGADHFYGGHLAAIEDAMAAFLDGQPTGL